MAAFVAATGSCAEWSIQPAARAGVDYDSNRGLGIEQLGDAATNLSAQLTLEYASERSSMSLQPSIERQRFADSAFPDASRVGVSGNYQLRWPTELVQLDGSVRRQSTLFSEELDSGVVNLDSERRDVAFSVGWSRNFSPRLSSSVTMGYSESSFDGPTAVTLVGYQYPNVLVDIDYDLSARTRLTAQSSVGELRSERARSGSRDSALQFGIERQLSESLDASLRIGANRSTFGSTTDAGYQGGFDLTYRLPRGALTMSVERGVSPSGLGVLIQRTEGSLAWQHAFTSRVNGSLALRAIRNDDLVERNSGERRRFQVADAGLGWRLTEHWSVALRAGLARALDQGRSEYADGWRAGLNLAWEPQKNSVSR